MNNRNARRRLASAVVAFGAGLFFFSGNPDNDWAFSLTVDSSSEATSHETKASVVKAFGSVRANRTNLQKAESSRFQAAS